MEEEGGAAAGGSRETSSTPARVTPGHEPAAPGRGVSAHANPATETNARPHTARTSGRRARSPNCRGVCGANDDVTRSSARAGFWPEDGIRIQTLFSPVRPPVPAPGIPRTSIFKKDLPAGSFAHLPGSQQALSGLPWSRVPQNYEGSF